MAFQTRWERSSDSGEPRGSKILKRGGDGGELADVVWSRRMSESVIQLHSHSEHKSSYVAERAVGTY